MRGKEGTGRERVASRAAAGVREERLLPVTFSLRRCSGEDLPKAKTHANKHSVVRTKTLGTGITTVCAHASGAPGHRCERNQANMHSQRRANLGTTMVIEKHHKKGPNGDAVSQESLRAGRRTPPRALRRTAQAVMKPKTCSAMGKGSHTKKGVGTLDLPVPGATRQR